MTIEVYDSGGLNLVEDLPITNYEAGQVSDTLSLEIWNEKGNPAGQTVFNLLFVMRTESATQAGVFLATGLPPQDELWGRLRITGFDNTGDPTFSVMTTDFRPLGAFAGIFSRLIPADCAIFVDFLLHPPSYADPSQYRHLLLGLHSEYSQPIPHAVSLIHQGIVTGIGDHGHFCILNGLEATASVVPDEFVNIALGHWIFAGTEYEYLGGTFELDQNDGGPVALAPGESYIAAITAGKNTLTVTKGLKDPAPTFPALPVNELFVTYVEVFYNAAGSEIQTADITGTIIYDRYLFIPDPTGLNGFIHAGQSVGGDTWRYRTEPFQLTFPVNDISYVWQLSTGNFLVTQSEDAPETTALGPFWKVTTDVTNITEFEDLRKFISQVSVSSLAPAQTSQIVRVSPADPALNIDRSPSLRQVMETTFR